MAEPSREEKSSETPINKTAVLGFRFWKIDYANKMFKAMGGQAWQPGLNYAVGCDHPSPGRKCACGFNAYFDFDASLESDYNQPGNVIGAFAGAGELEIHELGFRSSEAQIIALFSETADPGLQEIADKYSLTVFSKKKEFLEFVERYADRVDQIDVDYYSPAEKEEVEKQDEEEHNLSAKESFSIGLRGGTVGMLFTIAVIGGIILITARTNDIVSGAFEFVFLLFLSVLCSFLALIIYDTFGSNPYQLNQPGIKAKYLILGTAIPSFGAFLICAGCLLYSNQVAFENIKKEKAEVMSSQENKSWAAASFQERNHLENKTFVSEIPIEGLGSKVSLYNRDDDEEDKRETFEMSLNDRNNAYRIEAIVPYQRGGVQDYDGKYLIEGTPASIKITCESELCPQPLGPPVGWLEEYENLIEGDPSVCVIDKKNPVTKLGAEEFRFNFSC